VCTKLTLDKKTVIFLQFIIVSKSLRLVFPGDPLFCPFVQGFSHAVFSVIIKALHGFNRLCGFGSETAVDFNLFSSLRYKKKK
jgi:hypothetical protein